MKNKKLKYAGKKIFHIFGHLEIEIGKGYADMLTDDDLSDLLHDIINIEQRYQSEEFASNSSRIEELIVDAYDTAEADHHKGDSDEA